MCAKTHDFGLSRGSKPNGGGKGNGIASSMMSVAPSGKMG